MHLISGTTVIIISLLWILCTLERIARAGERKTEPEQEWDVEDWYETYRPSPEVREQEKIRERLEAEKILTEVQEQAARETLEAMAEQAAREAIAAFREQRAKEQNAWWYHGNHDGSTHSDNFDRRSSGVALAGLGEHSKRETR